MEKNPKSTSTGDASPLSTSTESESFDTWTLITDKSKEFITDDMHYASITPDRIEEDDDNAADEVEVMPTSKVIVESRFNDIDELSDGISIISDCESIGRVTPHPELHKHLTDLNIRFINSTDQPPPSSTTGESTILNYEACSERSSDTFHRIEPLVEHPRRQRKLSRQLVVEQRESPLPTLRTSMRAFFVVAALLAVLAFISKLKLDSSKLIFTNKADLLEQKLTELELNNNMMRAEIDILTRQVKYLTTLSENQKYTSTSTTSNKPPKKEKKIKVWPGDGDRIQEMELLAKCDDAQPECIKALPQEDMLSELDKFLYRWEPLKEKLSGKHFDEQIENPPSDATLDKDNQAKSPNMPSIPSTASPTEFIPHEHKTPQYEGKKRSPENHKKQYTKYDSKEQREHHRRDKSTDERNDSGERHKKSKDPKKYEKRHSTSAPYNYEDAKREADGQWHEKLMQHRENARKSNEKHRHDKNWFIERADSREQARVTEQKYRPAGER